MKRQAKIKISEQRTGFWLWDETRQMNLSMRAATKEEAYLEALAYYQNRVLTLEAELKTLRNAADLFVETVKDLL
jgi:hypothetical protein